MPIETEKRLIDANLNRLREGIRVLEDIARYILNDLPLSSALKELRHKARVAHSTNLLQYRDIKNDILKTSTPSEQKRENLRDIVVANFKRSEESARVLEEIFKLDSMADLAFKVGNSPLDLHSADFANLGRFADFSPVSHPKFAKNHESQTENSSVVDSAKSQNLGENISSLRNFAKQSCGNPPIKKIQDLQSGWLLRNARKSFGLPREQSSLAMTENNNFAESTLDSANQGQSAKSLCEIFKAIRYELYDIEIAYFRAMENEKQ